MEYNPWFVMVLGMGTVFIGLFCLIMLTKLMSFVINKTSKQDAPSQIENKAPTAATEPAPCYAAPEIGDRKLFDAVIAAAIAEYTGDEMGAMRIKSIKRIGGEPSFDRGAFVAAVSASLATAMGEDVSGIRIKSIKRI